MSGHPTNGYILLGILLGHAPNAAAQELMTKRYHEIYMQVFADYEINQELEIEKAMIGILGDGLRHGNWPWTGSFKIGDRVRAYSSKTDGVGTVTEVKGMQVTVTWDDGCLAPTMAAPAYFYIDKPEIVLLAGDTVQSPTWGPWGTEGREGN